MSQLFWCRLKDLYEGNFRGEGGGGGCQGPEKAGPL